MVTTKLLLVITILSELRILIFVKKIIRLDDLLRIFLVYSTLI